MKKYYVEDMVCNHCVDRIEKAMKEDGIEGDVNLASKLVSTKDNKDLESLLLDLGFSPKEM